MDLDLWIVHVLKDNAPPHITREIPTEEVLVHCRSSYKTFNNRKLLVTSLDWHQSTVFICL